MRIILTFVLFVLIISISGCASETNLNQIDDISFNISFTLSNETYSIIYSEHTEGIDLYISDSGFSIEGLGLKIFNHSFIEEQKENFLKSTLFERKTIDNLDVFYSGDNIQTQYHAFCENLHSSLFIKTEKFDDFINSLAENECKGLGDMKNIKIDIPENFFITEELLEKMNNYETFRLLLSSDMENIWLTSFYDEGNVNQKNYLSVHETEISFDEFEKKMESIKENNYIEKIKLSNGYYYLDEFSTVKISHIVWYCKGLLIEITSSSEKSKNPLSLGELDSIRKSIC